MYLCGYSLDNLSLMALTISTGFVVDDAIVVIENISRYREQGMAPFEAAVRGAREIGFTVVSISISLVAVFIPILLMGGIVGRLFREFAVTLSTAVVVSMVVSLTTTPMMCAKLLRPETDESHGRFYRSSQRVFDRALAGYSIGLSWVLQAFAPDARDSSRHARTQRVPVLGHSQGLLSAAGHGAPDGRNPGRSGHLVPVDARSAHAVRRHHQGRSVCRSCDRICRRQCRQHQHGPHVHRAQAAGPAQAQRRPGDRAVAKKNLSRRRCDALSPGRAGSTDRRPLEQRALSVHPAGIRLAGTEPMGAAPAPENARPAYIDRRQ